MYASFYKLSKEPFHITPDPEFLFLSPSHKEALGSLIYGVQQRKGFVLITGEVGVGKTTIVRSYLENVEKNKLKIIYIFNANVSFKGLLRTIYQELGAAAESDDIFDMVNRLHQILIEEYKQGCNVVLIIDEAQNMPVETLENLRMLSNLETSKDKLLQIVFSAQPEFEQKLNQKELRQLKQRIAVKSTILPLTEGESLAYIRHRLAKADADDTALFAGDALRKIVREARGIPRVINILCENALVTALGYQQKQVTSKVAREVIADFTGKSRPARLKPALAACGLTAVFLGCFLVYEYGTVGLPVAGVPASSTGVRHKIPGHAGPSASQGADVATGKNDVALPVVRQPEPDKNLPVVKVVKKGDTLSGLLEEVYGASNRTLLETVRQKNSGINNVDRINIGDRIQFPPREKRSGKAYE